MIEKKEIKITDMAPVRVGQVENAEAGTGCTVLIAPEGMRAGIDVRGGGPASRETQLLNPLTNAQIIHGIVISGGSAFGLGTANGVMKYLEEHDIGYDVGVTKVPLVVQTDLFDLTVGDMTVRPDPAMGYEAARRAMEEPNYRDGCYGAGCGATVGKVAGMDHCMKSGIGSFGVDIGGLKVFALVAVNAWGDVFDWKTGEKVAGVRSKDGKGFQSAVDLMYDSPRKQRNIALGNTTLGVVLTNAHFTKPKLCKIAGMAHNGYARAIWPVHTSVDGDSIFACSIGNVEADQDYVGTIAAEVMSEAILRAVTSAESAYGFPAVKDLK